MDMLIFEEIAYWVIGILLVVVAGMMIFFYGWMAAYMGRLDDEIAETEKQKELYQQVSRREQDNAA